ncbi:hypothetical protein F383_30246 [Gossypium arboreum]|uniref:Uncharacterized protein n=1 Tax=Gossypium arboreum TaxID=29729 RepID=A0A0B0MPX0_GOSAR|nr:hypothetical protein F383_30246 [Gossypium arboreum]
MLTMIPRWQSFGLRTLLGMYIKLRFIESRKMMNSSVAKLARIGERQRFASHYQNYHFRCIGL